MAKKHFLEKLQGDTFSLFCPHRKALSNWYKYAKAYGSTPGMFANPLATSVFETHMLPLGSYRHDIAYTAALKSPQSRALGSYRYDIAYTAALKSIWEAVLNSSTGCIGKRDGKSGKRIRGAHAG